MVDGLLLQDPRVERVEPEQMIAGTVYHRRFIGDLDGVAFNYLEPFRFGGLVSRVSSSDYVEAITISDMDREVEYALGGEFYMITGWSEVSTRRLRKIER